MTRRLVCMSGVCTAIPFCLLAGHAAWSVPPGNRAAQAPRHTTPRYEDIYHGYKPDFIERDVRLWAKRGRDEPLKLSYQKRFFNMSVIAEDARVDALIAAGRKKEQQREYRDAMKIYQLVIDRYPHVMYRIATHGIFIPARRYCQHRLLAFPPKELAFYRTLFDAPARDAYERARRRYSLLDLHEVADTMTATSYGDNALFALGNAALDIGNFEEALHYYRQVRDAFPDTDVDREELGLKIAYCCKALGLEERASGLRAGGRFGPQAGVGGDGTPKPDPLGAGEANDAPSPSQGEGRLRVGTSGREKSYPSPRPSPRGGEGEQGAGNSRLGPEQRAALLAAIDRIEVTRPSYHVQRAGLPHDSAADYRLFPPTDDPIGLKAPVWQESLPVSHRDLAVHFYPVATADSLIYRHKNIVYCRSLLSGAIRWVNDLGGRVVWQNRLDNFYPSEEVLVQDGLVFTNMYKGGASLVALDEVTGRLRWAHGPLAPVTEEDSRTSYFACPTGGRRTIYVPYIVDNIEGETHIDTIYGVRAFDSATGRVLWSRELCRLNVGKFMLSELITIRNRIRSFATPPVLKEGTLHCVSNAGVMAALEAATGAVKWVTRYPYRRSVHDRTRPISFGSYPEVPEMGAPAAPLWFNQRPLIVGGRMYVLPVDSEHFFCVDRQTGKILWSRRKGTHIRYGLVNGGLTYLAGIVPGRLLAGAAVPPPEKPTTISKPCLPDRDYLVFVYSGPYYSVQIHDANTGEVVWNGAGLFDALLNAPVSETFLPEGRPWGHVDARPFLTADAKLFIPRIMPRIHYYLGGRRSLYWCVDVKNRKTIEQRIYFDGEFLANSDATIKKAQREYEEVMRDYPDRKPEPHWSRFILRWKDQEMPINEHGPFYPFSRMTFERHGVQFEVFVGPRVMKVKYDRKALERALARKERAVADAPLSQ